MTERLCINCRQYRSLPRMPDGRIHECLRLVSFSTKKSMVTGETITSEDSGQHLDAVWERSEQGTCKPQGLHWSESGRGF